MLLFSDGAGGFVDLTGVVTPAPSAAVFRGQRAAADAPGPEPDPTAFVDASITTFTSPYGTELAPLGSGRWICVDAAAGGGGNGQSWATAFNTITAAKNVANTPGDVIVVKNGTYREAVDMTSYSGTEAAPIRVTRYGTHTPRVTGSEVLTGWTACTDQADALGSPQWANCYKAFVPAGDVNGTTGDATASLNGINLGLMQDQVKLRLAIEAPGFTDAGLSTAEKQDRAFNRKNDSWFYSDVGASVSYGTGTVLITNATALGSRTAAGLTHAWLMAHYDDGNNVRHLKITSFDEGTDTATCKNTYGETTFDGSIAVLNAGSDLTLPGFWVFSDSLEGDGTRKVVVYPYDGVDLTTTGTIEYCKRDRTICLSDRAWITVYGIDADGVYGWGSTNGNVIGTGLGGWNGSEKIGWHLEECSVANQSSESGWGSGFGVGSKASRISVINCTMRELESQAIAVIGGREAKTRSIITQNDVSRCFNTPIRPHSCRETIISFNRVTDVVSSHANGMSFYGSSTSGVIDMLVFGNVVRTGQGIGITIQDAANVWFIANDVQTPPSTASYRGIESNSTRLAYDPDAVDYILDGVIVALNNTCGPQDVSNGDTSGLITYKIGGSSHVILNNVAHGISDPQLWDRDNPTWGWSDGELARWLEVSYNVTTCNLPLSTGFLSGQTYDAGTGPTFFDQAPAMAGNVKNTTLSAVYTDVASGNYRPVASGPLDGTGLPPASSVNSAILFPDVTAWGFAAFDFNRDCDGNPLDWSAPPIGAYVVPA